MKQLTTIDDFVKVVQYKVLSSIKNHWQTLDAFEADWEFQHTHTNQKSNQIFARIVSNFHIDHQILVNIAGRDSNGSKQLGRFLDRLTKANSKLVYVHKKTATYKSGKKFNSDSWFYIPFAELKRLFTLEHIEDQDPFEVSTSNAYYTKHQHTLIDKWIFGYRKERTYVKTEKFDASRAKNKVAAIIDKADSGATLTDDEIEELVKDIEL